MLLSFDPVVRLLGIYPKDTFSKNAESTHKEDSLWVIVDNGEHGIT